MAEGLPALRLQVRQPRWELQVLLRLAAELAVPMQPAALWVPEQLRRGPFQVLKRRAAQRQQEGPPQPEDVRRPAQSLVDVR